MFLETCDVLHLFGSTSDMTSLTFSLSSLDVELHLFTEAVPVLWFLRHCSACHSPMVGYPNYFVVPMSQHHLWCWLAPSLLHPGCFYVIESAGVALFLFMFPLFQPCLGCSSAACGIFVFSSLSYHRRQNQGAIAQPHC